MNVIETALDKRIITESFLEDEVRCNYFISSKMKRIWAVELDLLYEFERVCDKLGLKYWATGGTLLGAIRHNGFIPWDDDIDVAMPRKDYNILMKLGPNEFKNPYFLQNPYTDPGYYVCFAKLRNSETTGANKYHLHKKFNQGLFIDIFPLDDCILENREIDRRRAIPFMKECGSAMKSGSPYLSDEQKYDAKIHHSDNPLESYETVQRIMTNSKYSCSDYFWIAMFTGETEDQLTWKKTDFSTSLRHRFEDIEIPVPNGYDNVLKAEFNDYMIFPPVEERGGVCHSNFIFDSDKPYTEYLI